MVNGFDGTQRQTRAGSRTRALGRGFGTVPAITGCSSYCLGRQIRRPAARTDSHLLDAGIAVETGAHGERTFRNQDLIVVSPGVPVDAAPLVQARALGQSVIGEIELASQFLLGPIVAITGSNGKTTTTTLVGEILVASGLKTMVGGNIGTAAISLAEKATPETAIVLEVSSFQLETIRTFRPKIAVVLNVTPDHLDRHRNFAAYVDAKARIFENQQADDFAVLNADDPTCVETRGAYPRAGVLVQPRA